MSSESESDPDRPSAPSGASGLRRADKGGAPPAKRGLSKMGMRTLRGTGSIPPPSNEPDSNEVTGARPLEPDSPSEEVELDSVDMERVTLVDLPEIGKYGNYELLGRIAYGGMAEIFLAREVGHADSRRMMVVKRVLPHVAEDGQFVDMFIDEARLAMQLNHPNICHVYSFGEAEGTYYIAMEWVNGKPLSKVIRQARASGGIPIPIAMKIVAQVAEALDYAHRASDAAGEPLGVVHRDVSPQNIMISYDGVVKLLDFGIAKATSHSTRTEAGVIKGKFAYMSPQQCVGEPIDARADIFALGICLYEALTGKHAFKRKTEFETMTKIVGDPAPRARKRRPEVPESVEEIIQTALMKQPENRYQTAGDMQMALETVLPTLGTPVNSSRIGDYLSALFPEDVRDGPSLDTRMSVPPQKPSTGSIDSDVSLEAAKKPMAGSTELDAPSIPSSSNLEVGEAKSKSAPLLAVGCLMGVLAAAGGGLAWWTMGRTEGAIEAAGDPTPAPAPPPIPEPPPALPPENLIDPTLGDVPVPLDVGTVMFESDPPGATITFRDREVGETPHELGMVEPGTYTVRLELDGHEPYEAEVVVESGGRASVLGDLQRIERRPRPAARPPGRLSVNTRPWSKVYVGRRLLGTTPIGRVELPSGTQRLRLVDRDGTEHTRSVRIPPGEHVSESFDLRE